MNRKKPAVFLATALLIVAFTAAGCVPRDAGTFTAAASAVSTAEHGTTRDTSVSTAAQPSETTQAQTGHTTTASEPSTGVATTRADKTTAPARPSVATTKEVVYNEWTYQNTTGGTVTYTENPDNAYIRLVSQQQGIPANRLSASWWKQGAAVFVFRSTDKNAGTLETAYFVMAEDMEVFAVSGTAAKAEYSKFSRQTAAVLFSMAMEHRP